LAKDADADFPTLIKFGSMEESVHEFARRELLRFGKHHSLHQHILWMNHTPTAVAAEDYLRRCLCDVDEFETPIMFIERVRHLAREMRDGYARVDSLRGLRFDQLWESIRADFHFLHDAAVECRKLELLFHELKPSRRGIPFGQGFVDMLQPKPPTSRDLPL